MAKLSVIEINGKSYDAFSGQLVGVVRKAKTKFSKPFAASSIDGLSRPDPKPATKYSPRYSLAKKRPPKTPAQRIHSRTHRAKTLMRDTVAKPARLQKFHKEISFSIKPIPAGRISRALLIKQHSKVMRFGSSARNKIPKTSLAAGLVPRHQKMTGAGSSVLTIQGTPSVMPNVSHQQLERLLDVALARADSHKQTLRGRPAKRNRFMPRWLAIILLCLAIFIAAAFVVWRYVPQAAVKVAAMKANVSASVPHYVPAGFKFSGPINYEDKMVMMQFKSNANPERSFVITQEASKMTSASLLGSAVPKNTPVQTSQIKGTTVYIYGPNNDATWVNNGVRYTLRDGAKLNPDQVLKIADSL